MSLNDERIRFYMKHRDQIEEWVDLRREAMAAIHEWLAGLQSDVEQLVHGLGPSVRLHVNLDDPAYPFFRLVDANWRIDDARGEPVSVSLEWARRSLTMRDRDTPYVGVRAPKTNPFGSALRGSESFRRVRTGRKDDSSAWWAAFHYVLPGADFPANTDGFRQTLLDALQGCWTAYAPILEEVRPV